MMSQLEGSWSGSWAGTGSVLPLVSRHAFIQGALHGELMEMTVGEEAEDLQEHSWTFKTHSYEAPIEESLHI